MFFLQVLQIKEFIKSFACVVCSNNNTKAEKMTILAFLSRALYRTPAQEKREGEKKESKQKREMDAKKERLHSSFLFVSSPSPPPHPKDDSLVPLQCSAKNGISPLLPISLTKKVFEWMGKRNSALWRKMGLSVPWWCTPRDSISVVVYFGKLQKSPRLKDSTWGNIFGSKVA